MRTLFADAPVVRVWDAYETQGAEAALQLFRRLAGALPEKRRSESLRHIFSAILLGTNPTQRRNYADAGAFFDEWSKVSRDQNKVANFYAALIELTSGDYDQARRLLAKQVKIDAAEETARQPSSRSAEKLLAQLEGKKPVSANVRFELKGYANAKFVAVCLPDQSAVFTPLVKTTSGWASDFTMPAGKVHYGFVVDGRMVLDPSNSESEIYTAEDGAYRLNVKTVR